MLFKPPLGVKLNPYHQLNKGLVGCWLINERAGLNIQDISEYKNHSVLTDGDWSGWIHGNTLSYDGSATQKIAIPDSPSIQTISGGDITSVIWLERRGDNQDSAAVDILLSKGPYGGNNDEADSFTIYPNFNNTHRIFIQVGTTRYATPSPVLSDNTPYCIAVVINENSSNIKVYLNGIEIHSDTLISSISFDSSDLLIGAVDGRNYSFNGIIDETRVYNRSLSENEIRQLYLRPRDVYLIDPVELWSLVTVGDDMTLADGLELSDSASMSASVSMSMSDDLELSDLAGLTAAGDMSMSDQYELSDTMSNVVAALMSLSDQYELSDSSLSNAAASANMSDQCEFADTLSSVAALLMSLSDTGIFSDQLDMQSGNFMNLADGVELSDTFSADAGIISMTMNDGFTLADALSAISAAVMGMEDAVILSDIASLSTGALVEGPITISVQVKQAKFNITIKKPSVSVSTKQPKFDIEIN